MDTDFSARSPKKFLEDDSHIYLLGRKEGRIAGTIHGYVFQHPADPGHVYADEIEHGSIFTYKIKK